MPEGTHSTKAGISAYISKRAGFGSAGWDKWMMDHQGILRLANPTGWGLSALHYITNPSGTAYNLKPEDTMEDTDAKITRYTHPLLSFATDLGTRTWANRYSAKDLGGAFTDSFKQNNTKQGPGWFDGLYMGATESPVGLMQGLNARMNTVGTRTAKNRLWELTKKDPIGTAGGFFEGATGLNRKWLWGGLGTLGALGLGAYFLRNRQQPQQVQQPQYPVGSWQQNPYNSYSRQSYGAQ